MILEKAGLLQQKLVLMFNRPSTMPAAERGPSSSSAVAAEGPFIEKRREQRYLTHETVEVCVLEAESRQEQGILRDVSRSGLRIELNLAVEAGVRLEVVLRNGTIIFGETRYCRRLAGSYQVGMVIEDVYYPKSGPAASTCNDPRIGDFFPTGDAAEPLEPNRWDRPRTALNQTQVFRCPIAQGLTGSHVSPDDVAAFLDHDLSETKTALVERHLGACEECSHLMRMILEDYSPCSTRFRSDTICIRSSFGRVTQTRRL
jgi:hypothetical protein